MATTEIRGYGHSVKRKEDPRFLRGKGNYIDDITLPGMLYMDIARSPFAHAKITNINTQPALETPGVLAVITGKDLDAAGLAWMPTLMSDRQMVLPVDTVMYQMQEVAAVIADSRYAAADGAAAVEVDYEPLEVIIDPFKALEDDAPILRPTAKSGATASSIGRQATGTPPKRPWTKPTSWSSRTCTSRVSMSPR